MFLWKCSFIDNSCYWIVLLVKYSVAEQFFCEEPIFDHFWTFFRTPLSSNSSSAKCSSPKQFFNKTVPFLNCCCVDPLLSTPIQYPKRPIADFFVHWIALLPYSPEPMLYWIAPLPICSFELPWIAFFVLNHSIYSIYWFVLWLKCDLLEKVPHWTSLNHAGISNAASLHWIRSKGSVDLLYSAWHDSRDTPWNCHKVGETHVAPYTGHILGRPMKLVKSVSLRIMCHQTCFPFFLS